MVRDGELYNHIQTYGKRKETQNNVTLKNVITQIPSHGRYT